MSKIKYIWSREILDSRGIPTVETACMLDTGQSAVSSVPAGTSTGTHEALELRDVDNPRYLGQGVLQAVNNVNTVLGPAIIGMDPMNQTEIDNKLIGLDGTENKSKYGANAILSVSEVVTKCGAMAQAIPLYSWICSLSSKIGVADKPKIPVPLFNMINGGNTEQETWTFRNFG